MTVKRGLNLGTPTKEMRREHAYDQCSMVLCHSESKAIPNVISSLLDTEYGRSTNSSPGTSCVVEGDSRETCSPSDTPRDRSIAHCKNVRGLGKSMVVFRLFEKLRYSNERSTKFESLKQE